MNITVPKDEFYNKGYEITVENSKCLLRMAGKSANEKAFGIASSLCILSAEEAVKAICLNLKFHHPRAVSEEN